MPTFERRITEILRTLMLTPVGEAVRRLSSLVYSPNRRDWFELTHLELHLPHLPPAFASYRIAHISDFHFGTWFTPRHLDEVVEAVNAHQPDVVALTGDFVTFHPHGYAAIMEQTLSRLEAPDGAFFVFGNHDYWTEPEVLRQGLQRAGLCDLGNRVHTLRRGKDTLPLAGVDCVYEGHDRLDEVLLQLPPKGALLLVHEPDFADQAAASGRFDLQLSGHSHGGQIRLPIKGPFYLPRYGRKYPQGQYQIGEMQLYTNRGLGTAELPIRFNCPPEIAILDLYPADSSLPLVKADER